MRRTSFLTAMILLVSVASVASAKIASGDVVLTNSGQRAVQAIDGKIGGSYATKNTVRLPPASSIGKISQTAVTGSGLAFTTALKGPSVIEPRPPQPTSYVIVSNLNSPGGAPRTFKAPGLGQGSLATCAVSSLEQNYGRVAAAPAAGNVTEVWLLVDCACNSGPKTTLDSYKILPFSYDSGAQTFQQNRGVEYTPLSKQCNGPGEGYYVDQLGAQGSNLTAVTELANPTGPTVASLVHYYNGMPVKTADSSGPNGNFSDNAYAIGGYADFFSAALRGVTADDPNPPQYTLVHYQAGKQPVLLGGIQPLPNGEFAPLLATRGGSVAEPLYYWDKEAGHVLAIDKRVPSKSGKAVFTTSGSLIDMDVVP